MEMAVQLRLNEILQYDENNELKTFVPLENEIQKAQQIVMGMDKKNGVG